ncbi:uncharacterized protein [Physcomitrium patens]|uniref:Uncharacterized protein n=2 Tax=Physcomitrium patens TaxID=3218 RepID=A0A2K1IVW7_PHYPA|nr:rab3 GTPase-activating protein catalytic subunit-like [Physcomitrium patens]PNR33419.1 hypothetical protein PHYPA_025363 [Physcomitrium patens]|eukprot:XP_024357806.1 rab3 GTPase-activating protein catalytic subunit-like [Physcomitrella patens]
MSVVDNFDELALSTSRNTWLGDRRPDFEAEREIIVATEPFSSSRASLFSEPRRDSIPWPDEEKDEEQFTHAGGAMDHDKGSGKRLQSLYSEHLSVEPDLEGFDDFTIASSWERFIAGVEASCREWMSAPRPDLLAAGAEKVEAVDNMYLVSKELSFDSRNFRLDFYFQGTSEDDREEWKDGLLPLQVWFNVTDFLLISPLDITNGVEPSEASLLLSTVTVALASCGSQLPAFVPVHEAKRKAYQGILGTKTYSARFEADRITSWVPVKLMHLMGLYDLFVSKLTFKTASDLLAPSVSVEFSMRLTYRTPVSKPPNDDDVDAEGRKVVKKNWDASCPWSKWHTLDDPVKGFELVAIWRRRTVTMSTEMEEQENGPTLEADKWLLSVVDTPKEKDPEKEESVGFAGRLPSLVLAFHLASEANVVEDFAAADKSYIQHITQSLDLPDPFEVDRVLKEVFQEDQTVTGCGEMTQAFSHGVKGSPPDSLFSRFCLHALQVGGCNIRAIAVLWIEFVREVRLFWDEGDRLPRMALDATPDPSTCLMHQKLQLLQLCIQQKAGKKSSTVVEDAPKVEQTGESQGNKPEPENIVEIVEETKHLNVDPDDDGDQEYHSPYEMSSEENWQATADDQLEMDAIFSPQEVRRKDSSNRKKPKDHSSTSSKSLEPTNKVKNVSNRTYMASDAVDPNTNSEEPVQSEPSQHRVDSSTVSVSSSAGVEETVKDSGRREMADLGSEPGNWWRGMWASNKSEMRDLNKAVFDYEREAEKVLHYLDTIRPQELLAQMLTTSYLLVADGLRTPLADYMVSPVLIEQFEELYARMVSLLPSLYMQKKQGEDQGSDVHIDLLHLCSMFEKVEENVLLAVSLGQKLKGAPRLLATFLDNYIGRESKPVPRVVVEGAPRHWKEGGTSEKEVVAFLFPQLGPIQAWKRSLRMGNFLNGHEPIQREIIFSSCYDVLDHYRDGSRRQRVSTKDSYTHRMYLSGTSSDLQVALSVISTD